MIFFQWMDSIGWLIFSPTTSKGLEEHIFIHFLSMAIDIFHQQYRETYFWLSGGNYIYIYIPKWVSFSLVSWCALYPAI